MAATTVTSTDVLIVGAGPTGLTMANLLQKSGVNFRIVDSTPGPTDETRALVVHAKTLELFDKLGVAEEAVEGGQRLGTFKFLSEGKTAGSFSFMDLGNDDVTPYPFALIYEQHRTERLLIQNLEDSGGEVEWSTGLVSVS